jgi:hypothetical protein
MCPYINEELQTRLPGALHMPNHEDDSQNQALYISDFILKRHLVYLYASSSISAILDPLAESLEPTEI